MSVLVFDSVGSRFFESGIDQCVIYPKDGSAPAAFNGVSAITENVSGGAAASVWLDGVKSLDYNQNEDYQATLEAFYYPAAFAQCNGNLSLATGLSATLQPRKPFDMSYRTILGNDTNGIYGYKYHLIYNCMSSPSERHYESVSDDTKPGTFSWQINATPPYTDDYKPTAQFICNSWTIPAAKLASLQSYLYGTATAAPFMPTQAAVIALLSS